MLVLTRKLNEKIRIGSSVTITVVRMKGKSVRLGIEAPSDVSVLRGELAFELPEEDRAAANEEAADAVAQPSNPQPTNSKKTISKPHRITSDHWPAEKQGEHVKNGLAAGAGSPAKTTNGWVI